MQLSSWRALSPGNFSFVMATGVLSFAFHKTGWHAMSHLFLATGLAAYVCLTVLFVVRLFILKGEILDDFRDIQKMFKYLTFSAGSSALAAGFAIMGFTMYGYILGWVGGVSAIALTYVLFSALFFHGGSRIEAVSPFWLLLAIAQNSVGITITSLWDQRAITSDLFLLVAFAFWTFGVFIYIILMTLNMYRMIFVPFNGIDMDPCYWTCMGAAAIAVVDGSQFILVHEQPLFLVAAKPFMQGMILFLWTWGTAWIPILCVMEVWKAAYFKISFHYRPSLWAMVFPLGTYTAATHLLEESVHLYAVEGMVPFWLWLTFAVWVVVACMSRCNPFVLEDNGFGHKLG